MKPDSFRIGGRSVAVSGSVGSVQVDAGFTGSAADQEEAGGNDRKRFFIIDAPVR
jgi:hypothetical protein